MDNSDEIVDHDSHEMVVEPHKSGHDANIDDPNREEETSNDPHLIANGHTNTGDEHAHSSHGDASMHQQHEEEEVDGRYQHEAGSHASLNDAVGHHNEETVGDDNQGTMEEYNEDTMGEHNNDAIEEHNSNDINENNGDINENDGDNNNDAAEGNLVDERVEKKDDGSSGIPDESERGPIGVISEFGINGPPSSVRNPPNPQPMTLPIGPNNRPRKPRPPPLIGPNGEPIKRKRGRPRKHPRPDPNEPPKKRGRPRKKKPLGIIGLPLASLDNLASAVGWTEKDMDRKLPSEQQRKEVSDPTEFDRKDWNSMMQMLLKLQEVAAESLYPANPQALLDAVALERTL